jgi:mRNA interferase MazF
LVILSPPLQGQVLKLNLDPALGHEQKGYRPVVVSASFFNSRSGFCWVLPITSAKKNIPNEIRIPEGFPIHGTLLLPQLRAIDWRARPFSVSCLLPSSFLEVINAALSSVLELESETLAVYQLG